ncbi:MAG: ribonuclease III [Opitutales bacterium]
MNGSGSDLKALQERLGYVFHAPEHLTLALTHPSYGAVDAEAGNNQRLEFLGDAVLGLVVAEELFKRFPDQREGQLQHSRAMLVQGKHLTKVAAAHGLSDFLRLGPSEADNRGRERPSVLEDALEAVIGAVYLDGGLEAARRVVFEWLGDLEQLLSPESQRQSNPKGRLNEWAQRLFGPSSVAYELTAHEGDPPDEVFTVSVVVNGEARASGRGRSKRTAEEAAARTALEAIESEKETTE